MTTLPAEIEVQLPTTRSSRVNVARFTPTNLLGMDMLTIEQDGEATSYGVMEMLCERGREFRLEKFGGEGTYTVYLPSQEAEASGDCWPSCDCPAGQSLGVCKHREAVQAVVDRGAFAPIANQ